jgi:hypothetical protein
MNNFLLPYKYKLIGAVLISVGLIGLFFYIWFDFNVNLPVFAIHSSYLETKMFAMIRTNIADEIIILSLLSGFFFVAFSKEKMETETLFQIRSEAFSKSVIANIILVAISTLFIYGNGFLMVLLINLYSPFIFYLIIFFIIKRKKSNINND